MVVFPALAPPLKSGRQINFLFSVTQVEDVIKDVDIRSVPFSPPWVDGITRWRGQVVPVISLEKCLGLKVVNPELAERKLMIRAPGNGTGMAEKRGIIKTVATIRMMAPPDAIPVTQTDWLPGKHLLRGIYEWNLTYLLVVDLERILTGNFANF